MDETPNSSQDLPGLPLARKTVRKHWALFLIEGVVLVVLGAAAIVVPYIASLVATIAFGWLLVVGGVVGLVTTIMGRHAPGTIWGLLSALLAMLAGGVLIWWPLGGMLSLTLVLAAFLAIDGVVSIVYALEHRRHASQRWSWVVVNGVLDLLLAGLIVWLLPGSAVWVLGLVLGIDLIFAGISLVAMALAARSLPQ